MISERMMNYLPPYWHVVEEMKQILHTQGVEFENLSVLAQGILTDAFILTASESRIAQWESWLKLPPNGTLEDRRQAVLALFCTVSKLNTKSIESLVAQIYNDARAISKFSDCTIKIVVVPLPENYDDELDFSLLVEALASRKPMHIGLSIERGYSTWGDIEDNLQSWGDVKSKFSNWGKVTLYIPR